MYALTPLRTSQTILLERAPAAVRNQLTTAEFRLMCCRSATLRRIMGERSGSVPSWRRRDAEQRDEFAPLHHSMTRRFAE